jgi:sugar lactone lactonase YvrE
MHETKRLLRGWLLLLALAVCGGCSEADLDGSAAPVPGPDLIVFRELNLQPEGVEYDARRTRFVVGSRTQGTIHTVDDAGVLAVLVANPGLTSTLGIHIADDRLWVVGAIGATGIGLGIYDLATGAVLDVVDLSQIAGAGSHLANDVTVDDEGNAYVTDTLSAAIYRVTPAGDASRFAADPRFLLINGIDFHPDGYLVVATLSGPQLLRVPLDAPASVTEIATPGEIVGDGIVFRSDGALAVVSNALAADGTVLGPGVTLFASDDGWQSAAIAGSWAADDLPTTAAVRGDDVYVIHAHLFDTAREKYEIVKAILE